MQEKARVTTIKSRAVGQKEEEAEAKLARGARCASKVVGAWSQCTRFSLGAAGSAPSIGYVAIVASLVVSDDAS